MIFAVVVAFLALLITYRMDSALKAKEAERNEKIAEENAKLIEEALIAENSPEDDSGVDVVIRAARQRVHCPTQPPYRNGLHDWVYRNDNKMQCAKCGMLAGDAVTQNGNY